MARREKIELKSNDEMIALRQAALVVADIHAALRAALRPGMTTQDLDDVARDTLASKGARSNFLGYHGFPGHICVSVNNEIVHGIPGPRVLNAGDIVSMDCGAVLNGWHGDACITEIVGGSAAPSTPEVHARRALSAATEEAMWVGIAAMARGKHVSDIGNAIDDYVCSLDPEPGIVEEFVGHGIGRTMHQPPEVVNYRTRGRSEKLVPGMVLCIEPMLTAGAPDNITLADDWTVVTADGSDAAHWEHQVALHSRGIWVLSAPDGGAAGLAPFGVTPVPLA